MNLASTIIDRFFASRGGELHIGGVPVTQLAQRHGSPVFIYDCGVMEGKLRALRAALCDAFEIFYSVKANPNIAILNRFVRLGCGLEVASAGELQLALDSGCSPDRILFAGPGKTIDELRVAVDHKIGEIHIESLLEATRISDLARMRGIRVPVAVRVNPGNDVQGGAMRMGGKSSPFGVDEEKLDPLLEFLDADPGLDFCGIHIFSGTQILDCGVLLAQYQRCVEIAQRAARRIGRPLRTVDFGGGLGIPYFHGEKELDLQGLRSGIASCLDSWRNAPELQGARLVVEPGRFLVGESGIYIARITDIKESRGKKFLVLDGGMNHHLAASGNLGQTIKRNSPIALAQKLDRACEERVDLVGPLCTPLDTLGRDVLLPKADVGDIVAILQSGAYARSASPLAFLSRNAPAEVWIDNGRDFVIRRAGNPQDFARDGSFRGLDTTILAG